MLVVQGKFCDIFFASDGIFLSKDTVYSIWERSKRRTFHI